VSKPYDFVVIGAGSAGLLAAPLAAKLGVRVALIERDRPGGDCLYTGCVPSKTLLHVAKVAHQARQARALGLTVSEPVVEMGRVSDHIQSVIAEIGRHESPEALRAMGIDVILGPARFTGPHTVAVNGREVRGRRFLICTGSRPSAPPIPGLDKAGYLTYEDLFTLRQVPHRLLVLGAGPVGMEMSQAFARLGAQVTVIQRADRLLTVADEDCSAVMADVFRAEGIQIRLGASVQRVERVGDEVTVVLDDERLAADALLVATGRQPNVDGLDLTQAGVVCRPDGIPVDSYLRTSQPHIYACGDVLGGEQFTHLAAIQAYQATRNALLPGRTKATLANAPWTVFTDPEVARVGLSEREARARYGHDARAYTLPLTRVDRAVAESDRRGFVKLVYRRNGTVLGAHVVAARAGEMIQEAIGAVQRGQKVQDLAGAIHVYPTYAVGVQQAAAYAVEQTLLDGWLGRLLRLVARVR